MDLDIKIITLFGINRLVCTQTIKNRDCLCMMILAKLHIVYIIKIHLLREFKQQDLISLVIVFLYNLEKKQKEYNYNKNTFISNKNTLDLDQYEIIVQKLCQNKQPHIKLKVANTPKEELEKILQKRQN